MPQHKSEEKRHQQDQQEQEEGSLVKLIWVRNGIEMMIAPTPMLNGVLLPIYWGANQQVITL
jgi:hypothetical protein